MTQPTTLEHVLAGLLGLFVLYAFFKGPPQVKDKEFDTAAKLSVYWSNGLVFWVVAIITVGVWMLAGRSLEDLGLTLKHSSPVTGGLIAAAFVLWTLVETWLGAGTAARRSATLLRLKREVPFLPETSREARHWSFMAVSAGITEEIIMRGFMILYLMSYMGESMIGQVAAVTIPAVLFGFMHHYQGPKSMLRIAVLALFFGAIFVVTGSLLIPIVLHCLLDLIGGMATGWLSDRAPSG